LPRYKIDFSLLAQLVEHEPTVDLIVDRVVYLEKVQCWELLAMLGGKYKTLVENYGHAALPKTNKNLRLVKSLQEKSFISSYSPGKTTIRVNLFKDW